MAINVYEQGDRIEITTSTTFQDSSQVAFDPDVVTFEVQDPAGTTTSYVNGTDPEVTNPATGSYTCTIDVELSGVWHYYIKGETSGGVNRGADQGRFEVKVKST